MATISHLIRIRATPDSAFAALATTEGIAEWFTQASSADYAEGGTLELRFPDERATFRVAELSAPTRVVWHCTSTDSPWYGTDIVFDLADEAGTTIVRFDHAGWPQVTDLFRDCSMSWAYFLHSLRALIEEGQGTPEVLDLADESAAPDLPQ